MFTRLYPPARPQTIGEVLDTTFKILGVSLLKTLPYGILMTLSGQLGNIYNLATGGNTRNFAPHDPASWLLWCVSLIVSLTLWAALILRQRAIAQGEPVSMRVELATALQLLPRLLVATLVIAASVLVGLVLLVVPGVYLGVALSMSMSALVLAHKSPVDALRYSVLLVRDHWWRTLAIFLITAAIVVVFYILGAVAMVILVRMTRSGDLALWWASSVVLVIALGAFANPCFAAMLLAVFGDLEVRRESIASVP